MGKKFKISINNKLTEIANSQAQAQIIMGMQQKELQEANRLKQRELENRDRVDIPLKDYNFMRERLEALTNANKELATIIDKFKLMQFVDKIMPETAVIETMKDPASLKTRVFIQFYVNDFKY